MSEKKIYEAPVLTDFGNIAAITQGPAGGTDDDGMCKSVGTDGDHTCMS